MNMALESDLSVKNVGVDVYEQLATVVETSHKNSQRRRADDQVGLAKDIPGAPHGPYNYRVALDRLVMVLIPKRGRN